MKQVDVRVRRSNLMYIRRSAQRLLEATCETCLRQTNNLRATSEGTVLPIQCIYAIV